MNDQTYVVQVAAKAVVIDNAGRVLILRESSAKTYDTNTKGGRYQLPGGRLDSGERFETGLRREALEETGLEFEALYPIYQGEWRPVIKGAPHQIIALFVVCRAKNIEVTLSEEHDAYTWIDPRKRAEYDIVPPDYEVIDHYVEWMKNGLPH